MGTSAASLPPLTHPAKPDLFPYQSHHLGQGSGSVYAYRSIWIAFCIFIPFCLFILFMGFMANTLVTWCKEPTRWTRPWCWERLKAGGEGDDRGWDGWMASLTQWTWVWVGSGSWWWMGKPGTLQFMGLQRVRMTKWLNWTCIFKAKSEKPLMWVKSPYCCSV